MARSLHCLEGPAHPAAALASVVLATGIVAFADPANANTGIETAPRVAVQLGDLDLRSDAGRSIAERCIHNAIDEICGTDARDLSGVQCRNQAGKSADTALEARIASL